MGNPHPTKSKPCKIGRKHCGGKSLRVKGRKQSAQVQFHNQRLHDLRSFQEEVAAYWRGERDTYPSK